jgi:hypothetical protein
MTIFGRGLRRVLAGALRAPSTLGSILGVRKFRNPLQILEYYFLRRCPPGLHAETRSGLRIHLSGDEDDIATLLVVFGRRDYGRVPKDGVVIDVRAHLGSFSLHAIESGAAAVYSYQPDPVLYKTLRSKCSRQWASITNFPFPCGRCRPLDHNSYILPRGQCQRALGPIAP